MATTQQDKIEKIESDIKALRKKAAALRREKAQQDAIRFYKAVHEVFPDVPSDADKIREYFKEILKRAAKFEELKQRDEKKRKEREMIAQRQEQAAQRHVDARR